MRMLTEQPIAADEAAQVTPSIVGVFLRRCGKCPGAHKLVSGGEVRPARCAALRPRHEFPATLGQKAVIRAGHQRSAVLERDSVRRLDDAPVREHLCLYVPSVAALADRTVDRVAAPNLRERPHCAVRQQDGCVPRQAVDAAVLAAAIRIDRLLERNVRRVVARDDRARRFWTDLRRDRVRQLIAIPTIVHGLDVTAEEPRLRVPESASPLINRHEAYCTYIGGICLAPLRPGYARSAVGG